MWETNLAELPEGMSKTVITRFMPVRSTLSVQKKDQSFERSKQHSPFFVAARGHAEERHRQRRDVMIVHSRKRMAQGNMRPPEHFPQMRAVPYHVNIIFLELPICQSDSGRWRPFDTICRQGHEGRRLCAERRSRRCQRSNMGHRWSNDA